MTDRLWMLGKSKWNDIDREIVRHHGRIYSESNPVRIKLIKDRLKQDKKNDNSHNYNKHNHPNNDNKYNEGIIKESDEYQRVRYLFLMADKDFNHYFSLLREVLKNEFGNRFFDDMYQRITGIAYISDNKKKHFTNFFFEF